MTHSAHKTHVAIVFGGRSGEHEISLRSARSIVDAIDRSRYTVSLIGIDRDGAWHLLSEDRFRQLTSRPLAALASGASEITLHPEPNDGLLVPLAAASLPPQKIDVVFPVLHGTFGEDGTMQGFLELADLPYVGAGVLGSALGMDKDVQKRLLQAAGIPVVPFVVTTQFHWRRQPEGVRQKIAALGYPLFVKPANLGSSVGITKVNAAADLDAAIEVALQYDTKAIVERGLNVREIECAVLGNDDPRVSIPGEICPQHEFYSYEAKYVDEKGAALSIPAQLDAQEIAAVQTLAAQAFTALECSGMARVDCFLERETGALYLNEINTIPGFTSISMYPKLWEASGIPYQELISRLIELARDRHAQRRQLKRDYSPRVDSTDNAARKPSK